MFLAVFPCASLIEAVSTERCPRRQGMTVLALNLPESSSPTGMRWPCACRGGCSARAASQGVRGASSWDHMLAVAWRDAAVHDH